VFVAKAVKTRRAKTRLAFSFFAVAGPACHRPNRVRQRGLRCALPQPKKSTWNSKPARATMKALAEEFAIGHRASAGRWQNADAYATAGQA
jgi:hypothetical protein